MSEEAKPSYSIEVDGKLLLRVLELGTQQDAQPFLEAALDVVSDAMRAKRGYLELEALDGDEKWSHQSGFAPDEIERVREAISRGIIAEALATGETIATADARIDERFRERSSIQRARIDAVLCVPLVSPRVRGVLYLQGRGESGPFSQEDCALVEVLARGLGPFAEHVLANERERAATDAVAPLRERFSLEGLIGTSQGLATALEQAMLAAPWDVGVLLSGPSGTGKSALARAIHQNSRRSNGPLLELNCAALPETLIENELFGSAAGAHSTADRALPGKVEAARGGTLFLDEIGELPLGAQAKLLHLIENRRYLPLGSTQEKSADVRIIAASNVDLELAAESGQFRKDLLYRLQVMQVRMPSLAERGHDVSALARHFAAQLSARHGIANLPISPAALRAIEAAEWPGNVRQLENAVEVAGIRAAGAGASSIERVHVFPESPPDADAGADETFQAATRRFQRQHLLRTLEACEWNVSKASRNLDISRSYIYELIEAHGIEIQRR